MTQIVCKRCKIVTLKEQDYHLDFCQRCLLIWAGIMKGLYLEGIIEDPNVVCAALKTYQSLYQ